MNELDPAVIANWHAHVYFDATSRDVAWALREVIAARLGDAVRIGRFHERPVGPHPKWTYQLEFDGAQFERVCGWLALNHGALDVLVHPNTGNELRDHRDSALWIGSSYVMNLTIFGG